MFNNNKNADFSISALNCSPFICVGNEWRENRVITSVPTTSRSIWMQTANNLISCCACVCPAVGLLLGRWNCALGIQFTVWMGCCCSRLPVTSLTKHLACAHQCLIISVDNYIASKLKPEHCRDGNTRTARGVATHLKAGRSGVKFRMLLCRRSTLGHTYWDKNSKLLLICISCHEASMLRRQKRGHHTNSIVTTVHRGLQQLVPM